MKTKKVAPAALASSGAGIETSVGDAFSIPHSSTELSSGQAPSPKTPFLYVNQALTGWQATARPNDAEVAWRMILAQLDQTRPVVVSEHHLHEAACRLERGRLIVSPPGQASAVWCREHLVSGRTRPLAVAVALAGLGGLTVDFE